MDLRHRNNVRLQGNGPGSMIFAHGFGCDQNMWRFVAPLFADRYRVVLYDHVGSGASDWKTYDSRKYDTLQGYGAPDIAVTITADVLPDMFRLSVHNEGPPIPAELLPTLFAPMVRGTDEISERKSIGLGLFIVREIAEAHGGQVAVGSNAETGTIFWVELPSAD